jgi:septum site-determining protein MinC
MTVALAGRAPATFEIKSANLPLVSLLLKSTDLHALSGELAARFGDIPDFFDNDPLVVDLSPLQAQADAAVDFAALLALLRGYRMMPVAARGGSDAQMQAASAAGLARAEEAKVLPLAAAVTKPAPDGIAGQARNDKTPAVRPDLTTARPDPTAVRPEPAPVRPEPVEGPLGALIIDKPLRSGQQVYARGRDLVVLCMVNAGAEVIADGHIHVYAPLRGKAIAGARGNTEARILSLCLEPELISIAGVYRTSEIPLPAELLAKPTQVRLVGGAEGKLVMSALNS